MPKLILNSGEEEFSWQISGLSSAFNQTNGYVEAGITVNRFTQSATSITGIYSSRSAPATGGTTTTPLRYVACNPGTYEFWAYTLVKDGTYWPAGSGTVTVTGVHVSRPDDWDWGYNVRRGARVPTAREWDAFLDRINEFRAYCNLSDYSFTYAYPGPTELTASMVNEARAAILTLSPSISPPARSYRGDELTADLLNGLTDALNSV